MTGVRWLFLDFDGTIADSLSPLFDVYLQFLKERGYLGTSLEFDALCGLTWSEIIHELQTRHNLNETHEHLLLSYLTRVREAFTATIPLCAGLTPALLRKLIASGFRLAIVTANTPEHVLPFLRRHRIKTCFKKIIYGHDVKNGKPAPDIYQYALRHCSGADPEVTIAVEDSENGVKSAFLSGLRVIHYHPQHCPWPEIEMMISRLVMEEKQREELPMTFIPLKDLQIHQKSMNWSLVLETLHEQLDFANRLWAAATTAFGVYDAPMLVNQSYEVRAGEIEMTVAFIPFSLFYLQRRLLNWKRSLFSVAVSGFVTLKSCRNLLLLAKRSDAVSQYQGYWECPPSGHLDQDVVNASGVFELKKVLLKELHEEVGVSVAEVFKTDFVGLAIDYRGEIFDFVYEIIVDKTPAELENAILASDEYAETRWVEVSLLAHLLSEQRIGPVLPATRMILEYLLANRMKEEEIGYI